MYGLFIHLEGLYLFPMIDCSFFYQPLSVSIKVAPFCIWMSLYEVKISVDVLL